MPIQIGYIDSHGHPRIRIRVSGKTSSLEADALIDTGFTGFLMLPKSEALPLGLPVLGTGDYILADGSHVTNPLAEGTVFLGPAVWLTSHGGSPKLAKHFEDAPSDGERLNGAIVLAGDDALIGMELVRRLSKTVMIGPDIVALMDGSSLPGSAEIRAIVAGLNVKVL